MKKEEILSWLTELEQKLYFFNEEAYSLARADYLDVFESLAFMRKALWIAKSGVDAGINDGFDCPLCGVGFLSSSDDDEGQPHLPHCIFTIMPRPSVPRTSVVSVVSVVSGVKEVDRS